MSAIDVLHYCFLAGCTIVATIPIFLVLLSVPLINRQTGTPTEIRISVRMLLVLVAAVLVLFPLGTIVFAHVWQLTPSQFVQEFRTAIHRP